MHRHVHDLQGSSSFLKIKPELQSPKIHVGEQIVHFLVLLKC
jgi:hypothetical protein